MSTVRASKRGFINGSTELAKQAGAADPQIPEWSRRTICPAPSDNLRRATDLSRRGGHNEHPKTAETRVADVIAQRC